MTRFLLVSADDLYTTPTEITLPQGLIVNVHEELVEKVKNKSMLKNLLIDLAKVDISYNRDGLLTYKGNAIDGLNFNDVVVDFCNAHFKHCYEAFYCLLRQCNIIF